MINCEPDLPLAFDIVPFPLPASHIQLDRTCVLTTNAPIHGPTQDLTTEQKAGLINSGKLIKFLHLHTLPRFMATKTVRSQ